MRVALVLSAVAVGLHGQLTGAVRRPPPPVLQPSLQHTAAHAQRRPAARTSRATPSEAPPRWACGHAGVKRLATRLHLSAALRKLALEFLPVRFYLVAALSHERAFVWQVAVSPRGALDVPPPEFLHEIALPRSDEAFTVEFLPSRELLMVQASGDLFRDAAFFDVRSGAEKLRLAHSAVEAVSPLGDFVAGATAEDSEDSSLPDVGRAIWNASAGSRTVSPVVLAGAEGRVCVSATFSPGGDTVAALLMAVGDVFEKWVEIWNITSGRVLCSAEVPHRDLWLMLHEHRHPLAYDGSTLAFCAGREAPALTFEVRHEENGCGFVARPLDEPCEDISLSAGRQLQFSSRFATIKGLWDLDASDVHNFEAPGGDDWTKGQFAPDGMKVLLASSTSPRASRLFLWNFAEGRRLKKIPETLTSMPVISGDSAVAVGIVEGGQNAVVLDLAGGPALQLHADTREESIGVDEDVLLSFAVSGPVDW